jgi:hypothetical protein
LTVDALGIGAAPVFSRQCGANRKVALQCKHRSRPTRGCHGGEVNFTSCCPAKRSPQVDLTKLMTKSLPAEPAAGHYSELLHIGSGA